jgi:hypothetical protein
MSAATTARLLAALELKDQLSGGLNTARGSLSKFESRWDRVSGKVKLGLVAGAGAAAGFVGFQVKEGLDSLSNLESAVGSVDGALRDTAGSWSTTGSQIATIANRIEGDVQAAFDDKDIIGGTAGLIRYGKLAEANLVPAMEVMTDLAARTGSVESASELLAKALADPTKAAGKLSKQGIILTKEQQKQIKAMVEGGDKAGAQALLLAELDRTTRGAAAALKGPYADAQNTWNDTVEDGQRAIAEGFLPVLQELRQWLSKSLGDPKTIEGIREFGKGLAGGLSGLIDIAKGLPWGTIGESLRIAGTGAKAVLDAFVGLPPWVQGAVVTGWGLNKLSGGALSGIVGELGKGLVKGVLNTNTAVMNVKAGVVNGVGGGAGGGKGGILSGTGPIAATIAGAGGLATAGAALGVGFVAAAGPLLALMAIEGAASPEQRRKTGLQGRARVANIVASGTDGVTPKKLQDVRTEIKNGFTTEAVALRNGFSVAGRSTDQVKGAIGKMDSSTGFKLGAVAAAARSTKDAVSTNTSVLRGKKFDPKIVVPVSVSTTFSIRSVTAGQRVTARYNKSSGRGYNDGSRNLDVP